MPTEKRELDAIVHQLEALNPTPLPFAPENRALLLGDWKLLYASNGTVITRRLPGGITIHAIWQTLSATGEVGFSATRNFEGIAATNGAALELPLLGRVQLQAQGHWQWQGETQGATVAFDAFSLQATGLFQQADWQLPALHIPVLEGLRREAAWQTSYLDLDLRIGRERQAIYSYLRDRRCHLLAAKSILATQLSKIVATSNQMIDPHVLNRGGGAVRSPLDR